jgi:hypothetical protein
MENIFCSKESRNETIYIIFFKLTFFRSRSSDSTCHNAGGGSGTFRLDGMTSTAEIMNLPSISIMKAG